MQLYLVEYHYAEITPAMDATRPAHRQYVQAQFEKGSIAAAGRATGESSAAGVFVLGADSADEARQVLAGDPFQLGGFVQSVEVRRWSLAFGDVGGLTAQDLDPE